MSKHHAWFIGVILLVFQVSHAGASPSCPEALSGHWQGTATVSEKHTDLALDFDSTRSQCLAYLDYRDIPLYGVPFNVAGTGDTIRLERHPAHGPTSKLEFGIQGAAISGTFDGAGVTGARLRLKRTAIAPHILREEAVAFAHGNIKLAGSLILPDGAGPYPAIVITQESGPESRDSASYRSWGELFARHGVAALIYDKRGTGGSTGDYTTASVDDLARDALAGLAVLTARSDIRHDRIGVAGHSQGGWVAPLAATLSPEIAFVFVTSASGIGPMDQSIFDNANQMRAAGYREAQVQQAQDLRRRMYQIVRSGAKDPQLAIDLKSASTAPWFGASQLPASLPDTISEGERRFLLFEPLPVWQKVEIPVLAIWGDQDRKVPAKESRAAIESALRNDRQKVETHMLPGLSHALVQTKLPGSAPDFVRGSSQIEAIVADWIARMAMAPKI